MRKIVGRSLGVGLSVGVFYLGLWALGNVEQAWVIVAGITSVIVGATMLAAVSEQIGKDFEKWDEKQK